MTHIAPDTRANAKRLRTDMTPQERKLWQQLREVNRMLGTHFRRQAPIGRYIADFADYGRRLVAEVDGGGHSGPRDTPRDDWLRAQGFTVLRFWNNEVDGNIDGVMQVLLDAVEAAPPPPALPHRGEGSVSSAKTITRPNRERASPPPRGEGLGEGGTQTDARSRGTSP
jgi:very-short-patch-repair endonuclease